MKTLYFYYDHTNGEGGVIGHFGELMNFIDNSYDKDRHSIHDCWERHKQCCEDNDNQEDETEERMIIWAELIRDDFK